jgi:cobalt/nickel transport protein
MNTREPVSPDGHFRAGTRGGVGVAARAAARALLAAAGLGATGIADAHFQLLYTPETALDGAQALHFVMVFSHPAHGGPSMEMSAPEEFFVVSQRGDDGEPVKTDLEDSLQAIEWQSKDGRVRAYEARLARNATRSLGDYVFVFQSGPYLEEQEDKYIQQFTKTFVNVGGVPGNWAEPVGLPTEIVPLDKPYANWTGGVFRGVVLSGGEPVPHAELEVEYVNHPLDIDTHRFADTPQVVLPHGSFGTMGIRANERGEFTIGLARAGWWGVCAVAVGPKTEHDGKPLSQDAVIWIQVRDMK